MPKVYSCSSCGYKLSLGWFHYHDCSDGYGSEQLIVCKACGAPHTIHIALPAIIQEEMHKTANIIVDDIGPMPYEVRRILREATHCNRPQANAILASLPGLFIKGLSRPDGLIILKKLKRVDASGHIEVTEEIQYQKDTLSTYISHDDITKSWQPCTIMGDRDNLTGRFELKEQTCAFCHTKGTLETELTNSDGNIYICPVCKKPTLAAVDEWRT